MGMLLDGPIHEDAEYYRDVMLLFPRKSSRREAIAIAMRKEIVPANCPRDSLTSSTMAMAMASR